MNPIPCLPVFPPGARILFQGDSITDGNRGRDQDPNHILGHGYAYIIAARHGAAFPEAGLEFLNRGVSGNTVAELEGRWKADTLDLHPDVLSVLVGINDYWHGVAPERYEETFMRIIDQAVTANPRIRLVLGEPFHLGAGRPDADLRRRQEMVARLAERHGAAFVRFQHALDQAAQRAPAEYWVWDGIHPTYRGHQIMADAWEQAVRERWS